MPDTSSPRPTFSALQLLQYTVLVCVVLYFGKALFIPLSFAMLISFIMYPVCKWLEAKGVNRSVTIAVPILAMTLLLAGLLYVLFSQLVAFSHQWQTLKMTLDDTRTQFSAFLADQMGLSVAKQSVLFEKFVNNASSQILPLLEGAAYSFSEALFSLILISVFSALILSQRQMLVQALYQLFPAEKREMIHTILVETIQTYYNFIKGMLLVYLAVGALNSIGLAIVGVPHPILFGFIASILTFIPYVGIMVASVLPIAVSWITFHSIWYPLGVLLVFGIVQLLEAYIIFPFAVGSRLKINTLAIIVMILVGGILWGTAGMILFIPFASIAKLIADRTPSLKTLAILLGEGESKEGEKREPLAGSC